MFRFDGSLEYEGGIKGEMREGFGKAYYHNGKLQYGGMWKEHKPAGSLVIIYNQGGDKVYEGGSLRCYLEEYMYALEGEEFEEGLNESRERERIENERKEGGEGGDGEEK